VKKRKEKIVCSQTSEIETGRTCTMILLCCQLFSKFVRPVKIAYLKSNIIPIREYTPFSRVIFQLLHNILRYLYIYFNKSNGYSVQEYVAGAHIREEFRFSHCNCILYLYLFYVVDRLYYNNWRTTLYSAEVQVMAYTSSLD